jgi:hypothetical protein
MAKRKAKPRGTHGSIFVNGRALNAAQERTWRMANEEIASADFNRIKRGVLALRALEVQLAAERAAAQVQAGLDDTLALALARGEKIEVSKRPESRGRVRIRSRDGLETLERSGAITAVQFKAGLLYRELYEATDPERDLRSHMADLDRHGGTAGGGISEAWAERRVRLVRTMAAIEAKVRLADRNDRAVRALREVAGGARCISQFVAGGGGQASYRRALGLALDVCARHFGLW